MKKKVLELKETKDKSIEKELEGVLNVIKDDKIKHGIIPKSSSIIINNFTGKVLKNDKSLLLEGNQYFIKKGTSWNDIDLFLRKNMSFTSKDFN